MGILSEGRVAPEGQAAGTPPPAAEGEAPVTPSAEVTNPFEEGDWRREIGDPSLSKFKTPKEMFESYKHLERKQGSDKTVMKPGEGATEEDWARYHKELGVPDLENYDLGDYKVHESNEGLVTALKEQAQKAGILPEQLKTVMSAFDEQVKVLNEEASAKYEEARKADLEAFKQEKDYNKIVEAARYASNEFITQEEFDYFEDQGILDDPKFIKMLGNIGLSMSEDKVFKGEAKASFGMSKEATQMAIQDAMNDPAYFDSTMPNHKMLVEKVRKLNENLYKQV